MLDECYNYEHVKVNGSWSDLEKYCKTKGGVLAFHKMQSLESRRFGYMIFVYFVNSNKNAAKIEATIKTTTN